jgi:hypothetical protein
MIVVTVLAGEDTQEAQ